MEDLHFSARLRRAAVRRRRTRRLVLAVWAATSVAAVAGPYAATKGLGTMDASELGAAHLRGRAVVNVPEDEPSPVVRRRQVLDVRTAPTRALKPDPERSSPEGAGDGYAAPAGSVTDIIYAAAAEFGVDGAYLVSIAVCESNLDPGATNPAGYYGLFQFDQQTWASYGYGSIYDPSAQARAAARLIAAGQASRWPNCA